MFYNKPTCKVEKILGRNQYGFRWKRSSPSQILTLSLVQEGIRANNLEATILFVDFSKVFDSIVRGKIEQILLAKENVAVKIILYKNMKVKIRSPTEDIDYFDIVAAVLQGDTLTTYLFNICQVYALRFHVRK